MTTTDVPASGPGTLLLEHIREAAASLHGLTELREADGAINAMAEGVADALLSADGAAMTAAASDLRTATGAWQHHTSDGHTETTEWAEERGRLYGILDVLRWVLQRRSQHTSASSIEPGSHAHQMLTLLDDQGGTAAGLNSGAIAQRLNVDKTQVSRTGRELIERGLATTTSLGRKTFWEITPRGQYALDHLGSATSRPSANEGLALSLGEVTDARAEEVARTIASRHHDVTALVFSCRAAEAWVSSGARRRPVPVMLLQAPSRAADQLQELKAEVATELSRAPMSLAVVPASDDGRVVTILPRTAAAARRRRRTVAKTP